ncbi:MAG: DUF4112 domain-containing protein [Desulforhopalus sp.]
MIKKNRQIIEKRLTRLAWLLDNSIPLPVINYRIGLDAIIGIIPGIGDAIGILLSSYILGQAARIGLPKMVLLRMVFNVAIEAIVGIVPFIGDIFDMTWKANVRNVQLLEKYMEHPQKTNISNRFFILGLFLMLIVFVVLMAILGIYVLRWFWFTLTGSG